MLDGKSHIRVSTSSAYLAGYTKMIVGFILFRITWMNSPLRIIGKVKTSNPIEC
jgi:hypothetical protein